MTTNAASTPSFSVDDILMGEILMSLKRGNCNNHITAPIVKVNHLPASYWNKMTTGLSVNVSSQPSVFSSECYMKSYSDAFNNFDVFDTLSPMVYKLSPAPVSPPLPCSNNSMMTRRGGSSKRYGPVVELQDLRNCFNMPIAAVADKFGICVTLLKKICRRHGIQRWPHRQIRSLQKSINMLRESFHLAKGTNREYIAKKITAFEYTLECIMQDPNTAAKGISTGRLASPATEEMIKRGNRTKSFKPKTRTALSDDEEGVTGSTTVSSILSTPRQQDWTTGVRRLNTRRASLPMSLQSILC